MPSLETYTKTLQPVLDEALAEHGVPGASVGILRGDDRAVISGGLANSATGVETTPETLFQIGSISKVFTATLVMQLVHAGMVELDEPVRGALHEFRVADDAATLSITPRHLLAHTSGIHGDHFLDCGRNPDALWRYVSTLEDVGQIHDPDDMFSYCNAGYGVLGRLVEEATGDHFARAFQRRIARPLELTRTVTLAEHAIIHRVAAGHQHADDGVEVIPWMLARYNLPIGGIVADVGDLLTFAQLHVGSGKVGDKQVFPARAVADMQAGEVDVPGTDEQWGLGWRLLHWDDRRVLAHDGDTVGQRAFLRLLPDDDVAIAICTNSPRGDHVADAVVEHLAAELLHVELPASPVAMADDADGRPDPDACTGIYERMHQRLAIAGGGDGSLRMTVIPDDLFTSSGLREHTITLHPVDAERWIGTEPTSGTEQIVTMVPGDDDRPEFVHFGRRAHRRLS